MTYLRRTFASALFDAANVLFFVALCWVFLYPIVLMISLSMSDPTIIGASTPTLIPQGFSIAAYRAVLSSGSILRYYRNSLMYVVLGTSLMLALTSLVSYTLIHRSFSGRRPVTIILLVTMFFSGGLVPLYLLVRGIGLYNTVWPIVLPGAVGAWSVIVFRTFFLQIPAALRESAHMDGAGHVTVLVRVILPLSKALLATFTLFTAVGYWNMWFDALIFLRDRSLYPIQLFLRSMLQEYDNVMYGTLPEEYKRLIPTRQAYASVLVLTIVPILCIYPFLQRYFAKGVLVGSLRG